MPSAHAMSPSPAEDPGLIAAAPAPTRAGVFGMARTTGSGRPAAASMARVVTPAATDRIRSDPASCGRSLRVQGDPRAHDGAAVLRVADREPAAERPDAIGETLETRAAGRVGA